jgi:recombinational DNA repair ATPase RecF
MLTGITLRNFRAFKEQTFAFKRLNVFVGRNNSGKSSVLSALNVIAQTLKDQDLDGTPLVLNGPYDTLGTYIDVVNGNNPRRKIGIDLSFDQFVFKTEYKYRTQRRQIDMVNFELIERGRPAVRFTQRKDAYDLSVYGDPYEKLFPDAPKRRPRFRNFGR